jgi:hypothetical protein
LIVIPAIKIPVTVRLAGFEQRDWIKSSESLSFK